MIEEIVIINCKRRIDRWYFLQGFLQHLEFPVTDRVRRFDAHDGQEYENVDAVITAAVADGFPCFADSEYNEQGYEGKPPTKHMVAANWSYVSTWREIVDRGKVVMLLIDNAQPVSRWDFGRFNNLAMGVQHQCEKEDTNLKILQLNPFINRDAYMVAPPIIPFTDLVARGFGGSGDYGFILSPEGAKMLMDVHSVAGVTGRCIRHLWRSGVEVGVWHTIDALVTGHYGFDSDRWKND